MEQRITREQEDELRGLIKLAGIRMAEFLEHFGVVNVGMVSAASFGACKAWLDALVDKQVDRMAKYHL